jgi:hypothetical protein
MQKIRKMGLTQITTYFIFTMGILFVLISAFFASSFLAILGTALLFCGAILMYITPTKHVPLTLLNAATISATNNIERILIESNLTEVGLYLPPKFVQDVESSIVFIPEQSRYLLPKPEDVTEEKIHAKSQTSVFITPPGLALSQLFEKRIGISFAKTNLDFVQRKLPGLLVKDMQLAETADFKILNDKVTIELTGNILSEICQETRKFPRTHKQVGWLVSSAFACILAKASGKVVIIEKDEFGPDCKTTRIEYKIIGE